MEEYRTGTRVPGSPEPPGLPERSWVGDGEGRVIPNFPPPSNCLKLPGRPQVRASQCTQSSQGVDPEPVWFVSQLRSRLRASYLTSLYWVPMTPPSEGGWKIERAHVHRCASTSVAIPAARRLARKRHELCAPSSSSCGPGWMLGREAKSGPRVTAPAWGRAPPRVRTSGRGSGRRVRRVWGAGRAPPTLS